MIRLNQQQQSVVEHVGNAIVTACPGSGKTRVLIARVIRGLSELKSNKHRVVALTFTNRATDEIRSRLDSLGVEHDQLWAGTIHAFALEWILRPYAPYEHRLKNGFVVADEYHTQQILDDLRKAHGKPSHFEVNTVRDRNGVAKNPEPDAALIFEEYQSQLSQDHELDYDDILHYAFQLLCNNSEIAATIGSVIRLFCVDEIQDTQDLHFGILSRIFIAAKKEPILFFVGDSDQCIYESLGAVSKTPDEIAREFGQSSFKHLKLTGNYRSTQRIIDHYQCLRPRSSRIMSLAKYALELGVLTFHNQTVSKDDLPRTIAGLVRDALNSGVSANEICILAPHWWHIKDIARLLIKHLPDIDIDAPGLSPLHSQRENIWFQISRLFLTTPRPNLYRTRIRWANEVQRDLSDQYGVSMPEGLSTPRQFLRLINSTHSDEVNGLKFLADVFGQLLTSFSLNIETNEALNNSYNLFFEKATARLQEIGEEALQDIHSFKKLFQHPSGIVISTCHAVKGEEYDTVIAFGLLKGYIPNWQVIIRTPELAEERASKLLYVICSRAKRRLHLIAESGRFTQKKNEYQTTALLSSINYKYDK